MTLPAQGIVERLLSNAEAHFRGVPLARRITGQQLSEAADTISHLTADNEALRKERDETRAAHHRTSHKAVKRLRALWREKQAAESRVTALEADVERLLAELAKGHWRASVYHCPPKGRKPSSILNATSVSIKGEFPTEESALAAARAVIEDGRPYIGTFIHRPSARPMAYFHLPNLTDLGRAYAALGGSDHG